MNETQAGYGTAGRVSDHDSPTIVNWCIMYTRLVHSLGYTLSIAPPLDQVAAPEPGNLLLLIPDLSPGPIFVAGSTGDATVAVPINQTLIVSRNDQGGIG